MLFVLGLTIGFRQRLLKEWSLGYIMGEKSHEKHRTIVLGRTEKIPASRQIAVRTQKIYVYEYRRHLFGENNKSIL
jgi:hypothetical protein